MNKYIFTCFAALLFSGIQAQEVANVSFKDSAKYEEINDRYLDQDAVLIYERRQLELSLYTFMPQSTLQTRSKLRILTRKGINDYSKIIIPQQSGRNLTKLGVRTIKKDGQSVMLNTKDIRKLDVAEDENIYSKDKYLLFAIPGVEVDDEIEIFTEYEGYNQLSQDVYLNSYLPCIHASFTLFTAGNMETEIKVFNGMPEPKLSNRGMVKCEWEMENVPSLTDQNYSIPAKEQPYFRYVVRKATMGGETFPVVKNSWADYIDEIFSGTEAKKSKTRSFSSYLDKKFGPLPEDASPDMKLKQLVKIHHFIADSIEVTWIPYVDQDKSLVYFMNKRKIDSDNLLLVYDKIFEYLGINYYIGFGRSKYEGEFDISFVAPHMITNSFLSFELDGFFYFLFLKNSVNSYELGEIPTELQGTNTMLISKLRIPDRIKQATLITTDKASNFRRVKITANVDLESSKISGTVKRQYSGSVATLRRPYYKNFIPSELKKILNEVYRQRNSNYIIDSVTTDHSASYKFPYTFNVNYDYHLVDPGILNLEPALYSISLAKWLENGIIESTTKKRITDFYSECLYSDNMKFYIMFNKKVEINNKQDIETKVVNEFGSFSLSVKQINETTILVESNYEVNSQMLSKNNYNLVEELENAFNKANTNQLVVKTFE